MIKLLFILLVGYLPLSLKNNNNLIQKPQLSSLIGHWVGKYDTLNAVLTFNKNHTGTIKWSSSAKIYHFKYQFKYDSIIVMRDKSSSSMHTVVLKGNKLSLRAYPLSKYNEESVDLIDEIYFYKVNSNPSKKD